MEKTLVALTGKTGAGKSTVSKMLKERGCCIIDGDLVAREVVNGDVHLLEKLKEVFGDEIEENGELDRKTLARKAFATPENTEKLNYIIHPVINNEIDRKVKEAFEVCDVAVVDAAAIIESGYAQKCDILVAVTAPPEVRLERIKKRDNLSDPDALVRMNAQKEDSFYEENADFIIRNFEPYSLETELKPLSERIFCD